ncbi:hypothetical protein BH20VER3_BH20VER3_07330 [soil metagenome]
MSAGNSGATHLSRAAPNEPPALARRLGLYGTTMAVMGGIIGAGIFINPYIVAQRVHTAPLILGAWVTGGLIALAGGFIYAELAARLPVVGGQYAYLREALHPAVAFIYGWALLLVIQTGGMAAVAVTFARYFLELTGWPVTPSFVAAAVLALLTVINCLGVKTGSRVHAVMTLTAIGAIALLEAVSLVRGGPSQIAWTPLLDAPASGSLLLAFGAAMTPVLFAYGGWQTSSFLGGEVRDAQRTLPRGLILGVLGVIAVYLSVNFVYLRALGAAGLAGTTTPASSAMRDLLGARGGQWIAAGVAISAFGFLAQSMLTAPRVYFAMADDGVFFRGVARVHPRTRVPMVAIVLQGGVGDRDRARRDVCAGRELRRSDGLHLLRLDRGVSLRLPTPGEWSGCLPCAGSSLDDAALHRGAVDDRGEHVRARSETSFHRARDRVARSPGLLFLAARGRRAERWMTNFSGVNVPVIA